MIISASRQQAGLAASGLAHTYFSCLLDTYSRLARRKPASILGTAYYFIEDDTFRSISAAGLRQPPRFFRTLRRREAAAHGRTTPSKSAHTTIAPCKCHFEAFLTREHGHR